MAMFHAQPSTEIQMAEYVREAGKGLLEEVRWFPAILLVAQCTRLRPPDGRHRPIIHVH